jgi:hypothetical protein
MMAGGLDAEEQFSEHQIITILKAAKQDARSGRLREHEISATCNQ